jgi:hypothetical protein
MADLAGMDSRSWVNNGGSGLKTNTKGSKSKKIARVFSQGQLMQCVQEEDSVAGISLFSRQICKSLIAAFALILVTVNGARGDDKDDTASTNWWIFSNQTVADIDATLKNLHDQNVRISDIQVTGKGNFTVTYVQNTATYGKQWWWWVNLDDPGLSKYLRENNARLISFRAYDYGGGSVRYIAVMISNTGADSKAWWWGANLTPADIKDLVQKRNARLTSLQSYVVNGRTLYAVIMIANTGADGKAWWWYPDASPQAIGHALTENKARLVDLTPAANGNFNAVMQACSNQCPGQWWYFGESGDEIMKEAFKNGARITTAETYRGCNSYCFAAIMTQGSAGLGHSSLVSWVKASKPFDLVWPTNGNGRLLANSGIDRNGIPFNPRWFSQIPDVSSRPDFPGTCFRKPQAFTGQNLLGPGTFSFQMSGPVFDASLCSSQRVSPDLFVPTGPGEAIASQQICIGSSCVGGLCQGPVSGHLNWRPATYTGKIYFDDWSKADLSNADLQDDDYNFSLVHSDNSGLTATNIGNENEAPSPALLLEFNSDETTGRFGSEWWKQFRNDVEGGPTVRPEGAHWAVDGHPAVVTGLLGLDGVHSGYTELHPVYSMAIHLLPDSQPQKDANGWYHIIEHWAFFLRNYGNEGNCSSTGHHWEATFKDSSGRGLYYIQLPWPQTHGEPPTPTGANVSVGKGTFVWGWEHGVSYKVEADPGYWTYLQFSLPNSSYGSVGADGEIYLDYTLGRVAANPVVAPQTEARPAKRTEAKEVDWNEIQKHVTDPAVRERLMKALAAAKPTPIASKGEPITADTQVGIYNPATSAPNSVLTEDRATVDPVKQKRLADIKDAATSTRH